MLFGGGSNNGERNVHPAVAILIMMVAPIAAMLIQMAISRAREFGADQGGAEISGDPGRWLRHCAKSRPMRMLPAWKRQNGTRKPRK